MADFKPFENDEQSWSAGEGDGLTINNGQQTLSIYGEVKFAMANQGAEPARELLAIFKAMAAQLPPGEGPKALWVKNKAGSVSIGGDVDLEKGKTGVGALSKAIAALESLTAAPHSDPKAPKV